jgi:CDP-glucose 4,6-dehydratase
MHYLVTGHTGFKGTWLTLLLIELGHEVSGISLDPEVESLFNLCGASELLKADLRFDIRDAELTQKTIQDLQPDVVLHLAAQPLVRESYENPRLTFETNVNGTLDVISATVETKSVKCLLVVTTDKVYRNVSKSEGYVESDPLGGEDPYSASKAMAEILTHSWAASFPGKNIVTARGGNVIGGGDFSKDRLLPDIIRSFTGSEKVMIRNPNSVRPWQHVLDCLSGYLAFADYSMAGGKVKALNFGPEAGAFFSVQDVLNKVKEFAWPGAEWTHAPDQHKKEMELLSLNSSLARSELPWLEKLDFNDAIEWTINWHKLINEGANAREITTSQIRDYLDI